ncbi:hypothetical protein DSM106972_097850 [Dulcicalothrix desertica PCC 7102]|uniref:ABC transporter domain-containing protein n=1 Tax=Dulcicalothrix desertica PCC 7102 TaxID=232991 RepID=A0A3S1A3S7_9CYAN|nr:ABC transporter ATP-binding protein/permease [Dulcicalothrix desertica]RUS92890.1 hypothetical protein DSM106972_097850 [Dulcicalothrix desertica PCC 7102]TWH61437.1 ABC-type multidrug transport system ATPase subunit [Dulcicalothrix desertica PCC 7102]
MNLIELHNVHKKLSERFCLEGINLIVKQGEFVILKGLNGSGKTTLLNLILGLDVPDSGEVKLDGYSPLYPKSKNHVGAVLQTVKPPKETKVKEFVELWRSYYPNPLSAEEILSTVNLEGKHDDFLDKLSGGEKQRIIFALGIADKPKCLIVDEPTKELDLEGKEDFWEQIKRCREMGITILMVTNESSDQDKIKALATRSITLEWNKEDGKSKIVAVEIIRDTPDLKQKGNSTVESQNLLSMLWRQTWIEFLKLSRNRIYLLGLLLFPCMVVFLTPNEQAGKIELLCFAGISLLTFAIERLGNVIATERSEGWLKLLRVSPLPPTVYLAAKILVSLAILTVNLLLVLLLGAWRLGIHENLGRWLVMFFSFILGIIPFVILGLALGYLFKPKSVNVITGLSIPFALFTCGLPLPVSKPVQDLIAFSPFCHYGRLVMWSAGMSNDNYVSIDLLWLLWAACIFGFLAVWAYQHDAEVQR